jgi:sodium-dependent dicarboxylate transporter 2/3/5
MKPDVKKLIIVLVAVALFFAVTFMPIQGLEITGRMYLGMVVCLLILWFTTAVPAPVTFFIQIGLLTLVMPRISDVTPAKAFSINMVSLATNTFSLFICAFFLVSAVDKSGLARRIALFILKVVGPKPKMFIAGLLFAGAFLNIFLPAAMSVSALLTGIVGGMLVDYKMDKDSNLSKSIYLAVGIGTIAGNIFIQTAGAPAVAITGLISSNFGYDITYFEYMKFGLPLAILMDVFAFILIVKLFPSEHSVLPGGREYISQQLKSLGEWRPEEIKTGIVLVITVLLWMTGSLHGVSTQTVALLSCTAVMCPVIGSYTFKELTPSVPWGTIIFCGSSMSLASGMVTYGTAAWLVEALIRATRLTDMPFIVILVGTLIIMSACACAFTTRVATVNSIIPCVVLLGMAISERFGASFNPMGFAMVMFYPLLFTVILPVHTPYTLIPQAAGGFESKDLVKVQVPYVLLTIGACVLLYFTYWRLVGLT